MFALFTVLFVIVCFFLVIVVLMQAGRGGGLSGAFGGGGNQTLFGGRGAVDFLGKATWVLGSAYMLIALLLAVLSASDRGPSGLIEKREGSFPVAPANPLTPPAGQDQPLDAMPGNAPATETPSSTPAAPEGGDGAEPGSGQ